MEPFLKIYNVSIQANGHYTLNLPVAKLYTHSSFEIPLKVFSGSRPGPIIFVCAGIHGDEVLGVEIIRRLNSFLQKRNLAKGVLITIPVVNVHGFIIHSRYLPDRRDLNRSFPGTESGSHASRLAWLFFNEIVSKCSHGIDIHTASNHRFNLPHIRTVVKDQNSLKLAKAFGPPVILDSKPRSGSLRESAKRKKIPILLYEAGEVLRFHEPSVKIGLNGILSVMNYLGMIRHVKLKQVPIPFVAKSSTWFRAPQSGIFQANKSPGSRIKKGDVLGTVSDPFGENSIKIKSHIGGIIIGETLLPLVNRGDAVLHVARKKGATGPDNLLEQDFQMF